MDMDKRIREELPRMIEDIRSLVAIRSVKGEPKEDHPFGEKISAALEEALKIGRRLGFRCSNLDNYVGYAEIGEGARIIGIMCHVDVVPEGTGWTYPPFDVTNCDGKLYGRGVCDDKGPLVMLLYAMRFLADSGVPMDCRVRLIIGGDEESDLDCIRHYKRRGETIDIGFSPDAEFPVIYGEKGVLKAVMEAPLNGSGLLRLTAVSGGTASNSVCGSCCCELEDHSGKELLSHVKPAFSAYAERNGFSCKVLPAKNPRRLHLTLTGESAHASLPHLGRNAAGGMMEFLASLPIESPFVDGYMHTIGRTFDGALCGINYADLYGNVTVNVGVISTKGDNAQASLDIRYPFSCNFSEMLEQLQKSFQKAGMKFQVKNELQPKYVSPDSALVQSLHHAYVSVTGDSSSVPLSIRGVTYAREFPNVVAFGPAFPGASTNVHMPDECLEIKHMVLGIKIYMEAIRALLELEEKEEKKKARLQRPSDLTF